MSTTTISNYSTLAATVAAGNILTITSTGAIAIPTGASGFGGTVAVTVNAGTFLSSGVVHGGAGAGGGASASTLGQGGSGYAGYSGGAGLNLNSGNGANAVGAGIIGGSGGDGGDGEAAGGNPDGPGGNGGVGGVGAAGVNLASSSLTNSGHITGGAGGGGGYGGSSGIDAKYGIGGTGGPGGTGVVLTSATLSNRGAIAGGVGGAGGYSKQYGSPGRGGEAVVLASGTLTNFGHITGGAPGLEQQYYASYGDGVLVNGSGTITNRAGGTISGYHGVMDAGSGHLTVTNAGVIVGSGISEESVYFTHGSDRLIIDSGATFTGSMYGGGGTLELHDGSGKITGLGTAGTLSGGASGVFSGFGSYVIDSGAVWTVAGTFNNLYAGQTLTNAGELIIAQSPGYDTISFYGVHTLSGGGTVILGATGYISGPGSLTNLDNTIEGGGRIKGVTLTNDGTIDNDVGRMILNTGGTVTNNGIIESTGSGILLVRNTTIDSSGGGFVTDSKRLQLSNGTISGGVLTINTGAVLINDSLGGTVALGTTVHNSGSIESAGGGLTIDGDVTNNGLIEALTGKLTIKGAVSGTGRTRLWGKGVLELDGAVSENVFFAKNSTGTLTLGDITPTVNGFTGKIYGFSKTGLNSIDLTGIVADNYSYKGSLEGGVLTLTDGGATVATLKLMGDYRGSKFVLASDGGTGTIITDPPKTTQLTQAMSAFGAAGGSSASTAAHALPAPPPLSLPR